MSSTYEIPQAALSMVILGTEVRQLTQQLREWVSAGRGEPITPFDAPDVQLPLDRIATVLQLSPFERRVLLAAAAIEIDTDFAAACAEANGDERARYPTFQIMLATFSDAHWDAISPSSPLRRWRLITVSAGETITSSRIRIDERILNYLLDVTCDDGALSGIWQPVPMVSIDLPPSQAAIADRIADMLASRAGQKQQPVVQITGADAATRRSVLSAAAVKAGLRLGRVVTSLLPSTAPELQAVAHALDREAALTGAAIYLSGDEVEFSEAARPSAWSTLLEMVNAPILIGTEEIQRMPSRDTILFELTKPSPSEQIHIWREALGVETGSPHGLFDRLCTNFYLGAETIHRNSELASAWQANVEGDNEAPLADCLWEICRTQSRVRMDRLAQRVEADSSWDDLVLPERELSALKAIALQMQHRLTVHEGWGFKGSGGRGMGLTAIFCGVSGTGKTTAAEVLAKELKLDLFRIDLSHTISKYIGETARNLRRVFDAAEEAGAILLFDEADALFGKRSEVRDSHDRYANAEVSYLLQRMELYRGLALLSTNMKQAIDAAFMRRVRFVVQFPFPDAAMRELIWRRSLPPQAPTQELDYTKLARLSVTGANIRNIALNAAFLAAATGEPIRMAHMLEAAKTEASKLERPLPEQEIRGWL